MRVNEWRFVEDPRLIGALKAARAEVAAQNLEPNAQMLADAIGESIWFVLLGVSRQNAWDELGLNHDKECEGPQYRCR